MKLWIGTITVLGLVLTGCGGSTPSTPPADLEVDESNLEFEMSSQPLVPDSPGTDAPSAEETPPGDEIPADDAIPADDNADAADATEEPPSGSEN